MRLKAFLVKFLNLWNDITKKSRNQKNLIYGGNGGNKNDFRLLLIRKES
jgi:hypothetical protein